MKLVAAFACQSPCLSCSGGGCLQRAVSVGDACHASAAILSLTCFEFTSMMVKADIATPKYPWLVTICWDDVFQMIDQNKTFLKSVTCDNFTLLPIKKKKLENKTLSYKCHDCLLNVCFSGTQRALNLRDKCNCLKVLTTFMLHLLNEYLTLI